MKNSKITTLRIFLFVTLVALLSCGKESVAPVAVEKSEVEIIKEQLKDPVFREAFYEAIKAQLPERGNKFALPEKGANFVDPIPAWLPGGFLLFSGAIVAFFDAPYDDNDFYRENPDGTVSVHHTSQEAFAAYFNFETGEEYVGEDARLYMKYTGTYREFPIPGTDIIIKVVDLQESPNARVWRGSGIVQSSDGEEKMLSAKLTVAPSGERSGNISLK